jgi:uncharacterized protein (DUF736 family)
MEKKESKKPDFSGEGLAVWERTDKNGNKYLSVRVMGLGYVNCWRVKSDG